MPVTAWRPAKVTGRSCASRGVRPVVVPQLREATVEPGNECISGRQRRDLGIAEAIPCAEHESTRSSRHVSIDRSLAGRTVGGHHRRALLQVLGEDHRQRLRGRRQVGSGPAPAATSAGSDRTRRCTGHRSEPRAGRHHTLQRPRVGDALQTATFEHSCEPGGRQWSGPPSGHSSPLGDIVRTIDHRHPQVRGLDGSTSARFATPARSRPSRQTITPMRSTTTSASCSV